MGISGAQWTECGLYGLWTHLVTLGYILMPLEQFIHEKGSLFLFFVFTINLPQRVAVGLVETARIFQS